MGADDQRTVAMAPAPPAGGRLEYPPAGHEPYPTSARPQYGQPGHRRPSVHRGRVRRTALIVSAAAALIIFAWTSRSAGPPVGPVVPAEVSRGVVDVVSTLGVQAETVSGTGMVLTSSGEVLTNNHVINDATGVDVTDVADGRSYTATVVGTDAAADVAVLQMDGASGLQTAPLGDSSSVHVGDAVVAIGNAGGVGGAPSSARGTVVSLDQSIVATDPMGVSEELSGLIQTSAAVRAGDSGGPLADADARVIAMDTAASNGYSFGSSSSSGYAIPIDTALGIATRIEDGRASSAVHVGPSAFLGVAVENATGGSGAFVADVVGGSPAARIGISVGDVIRSVGGAPVSSASGLTSDMRRFHPGDSVHVGWVDASNQRHSAIAVLVTGPAD